jgi:hypothetical protein
LSSLVLRCGDAPVPITLSTLPTVTSGARPTDAELDEEVVPILDANARLIVLGGDDSLAAVLTHLMRNERLGIEVAYVPADRSPASRNYQLGVGSAAAKHALDGTAAPTPLIRDDTGVVLVGRATIHGANGSTLEGEAYVDDTRLFSGTVTAMHIEPTAAMPGLGACVERGRLRRNRWTEGRAAQLGTPGAVVTRDGIPGHHTVKRSSFYRHHEPWLLVR